VKPTKWDTVIMEIIPYITNRQEAMFLGNAAAHTPNSKKTAL
jgi:hypothetical protein